MSDHAARAALTRMNLREVAVAAHQTTLVSDLREMAQTKPEDAHKAFMERRAELCMAYGLSPSTQDKPFAYAQGVAIVPVTGTLVNRFNYSYGFVTGYNFLRSQVAAAGLDPDVKLIVYDMNSYGGEAAGCFETSRALAELANGKPTLAVIDSNCYSACYAIAAMADRIVATPSSGAGSIGVVAMHVDMSKMLDDWGIKVTFIHAGAHKVDGNPYEPLPDEVRADIQASVDKSRQGFAELVAEGRKMDVEAVLATEARCYRAEDAMNLGFIDAIAQPSEAVRAFLSELSGSNHQLASKEPVMADQETKPGDANAAQAAAAEAANSARVAERARISGIQGCEEAKGRSALANHLAMNTNMSVDDAKAILAAAPAEQAKPAAESTNRFEQAMNTTRNPNVGSDATATEGAEGGESASAQILRNQALVTGVDHTKK